MKDCYFCKRNIKKIDYKDIELLSKFLDPLGKIKPRRQSKVCAKHQRKLSKTIKKARILGLLPFTTR